MLGYREAMIISITIMVLVSFLFNRPHLFAACVIVLVPILLWKRLRRIRPARITIRVRFRIKTRSIKADMLASAFKPLLSMPAIHRMQDRIEQKVKPEILRSGYAKNPRIIGSRSILYPLTAGTIMVPCGIILSVWLGPAFLALAIAPVLLAGVYFVVLRVRTSERSSAVTEELAAFAILSGIMESVGVSMFTTLMMLARSPPGIFAMMRREGRRIRDLATLGRSPTDALLELSDSHPNTEFRDFVSGYVSAFNTGGSDTAGYLHEQANRFFRQVQFRMVSYTKQADMIAQVILTIMMLLPMMGLSMMFFSSGHLAGTMTLLLITVFPFITVVLIGMVQMRQPRVMDGVKTSWVVFPAGAACAIVVYFIRPDAWEVAGAGIVAASFLNHIFTRKRFAEINSADMALPEFMRSVTRFRNLGFDIVRAIKVIRSNADHRPGSVFGDMIDVMCKKVSTGSPLEDAIAHTAIPSWNARLAFYMLGKINESGGGTAKTISDLTHWITQYSDARKEMVASLRSSLVTAFVGPGLMVLMMAVSDRLAATFESGAISDLSGLQVGLPADLVGLSEMLVITSVACMGVVLSKINYFTVKHTLFTGIITSTTMVLLYAVPYFPDFGF